MKKMNSLEMEILQQQHVVDETTIHFYSFTYYRIILTLRVKESGE